MSRHRAFLTIFLRAKEGATTELLGIHVLSSHQATAPSTDIVYVVLDVAEGATFSEAKEIILQRLVMAHKPK